MPKKFKAKKSIIKNKALDNINKNKDKQKNQVTKSKISKSFNRTLDSYEHEQALKESTFQNKQLRIKSLNEVKNQIQSKSKEDPSQQADNHSINSLQLDEIDVDEAELDVNQSRPVFMRLLLCLLLFPFLVSGFALFQQIQHNDIELNS